MRQNTVSASRIYLSLAAIGFLRISALRCRLRYYKRTRVPLAHTDTGAKKLQPRARLQTDADEVVVDPIAGML